MVSLPTRGTSRLLTASLATSRTVQRAKPSGGSLQTMVLAWCPGVFALNPSLDVNQYAHTRWKVSEGFCKGVIRSIAQTPDGYLWVGTDFGLFRFDGVRAVPWDPPAGEHLPGAPVTRLLGGRDPPAGHCRPSR